MIDVYGSLWHYLDHLAPIWRALPDELRGDVLYENRRLDSHPLVVEAKGIKRSTIGRGRIRAKRVVVAGSRDAAAARRWGWGVALVEHGAGQTYSDAADHPSYAGGSKREGVGLFLCTNVEVARRNEALYGPRSVVVGSPRLDDLGKLRAASRLAERPVLALSFHWACRVSRESGTAFPFFERSLVDLVSKFPGRVIGHGHPRILDRLRTPYRAAGIEVVETFEEVVQRADVVSFDNTSAGFEAAALGIPVVVLDSPEWRKDVDHGLRFWEWSTIGPRVSGAGNPNEIADLWVGAANAALRDDLVDWRSRREAMAAEVYPYRGQSTELAVEALTFWVGGQSST